MINGPKLRVDDPTNIGRMSQPGEGVQFSRGSMICRVCQRTFPLLVGTKRMGSSNIGWCPEHQAEREARLKQREIENKSSAA